MTQRVVRYATAAPAGDRRRLPACLSAEGAEVLLSRDDGISLANSQAAERPQLIDALFFLRADLADVMWVPDWSHLGDQVTRALVCAEVWQAQGALVVDEQWVTRESVTAYVDPELLEHACAAAAERYRFSPRTRQLGTFEVPGDLGMWDGPFAQARLVHRLTHTSRLSQKAIAHVLERAGFDPSSRTGGFSARGMSRLMSEYQDDLMVTGPHLERTAWGGVKLLGVLTEDEMPYEEVASAFRDQLAACDPTRTAHLIPLTGERIGAMLEMARVSDVVHALLIGDGALSENPLTLAVATAWLRSAGATVSGATAAVDSGTYWETDLGRVMNEGTRLFFRLRLHDAGTVIETAHARGHAQAWATQLKASGESYRAIANAFNRSGIPTRRSTAGSKWSPSAVHGLLEGGGR